MTNDSESIDIKKIEISIKMLTRYVNDIDIEVLISNLESIIQDPQNKSLVAQLSDTFNGLGVTQGAVLTYAPYIGELLTDDPFENL